MVQIFWNNVDKKLLFSALIIWKPIQISKFCQISNLKASVDNQFVQVSEESMFTEEKNYNCMMIAQQEKFIISNLFSRFLHNWQQNIY